MTQLKQYAASVIDLTKLNDFKKARIKISFYYLLVIFLILNIFVASLFWVLEKESQKYQNNVKLYIQKQSEIFINNDTGLAIISVQPKVISFDNQDKFLKYHKVFVEILKNWLFEIEFFLMILGAILAYYFAGISLRKIEENDQKQKRLLSDISHELKNPLSAIKMSLEVSEKQKEWRTMEVQEVFRDLKNEVSRLIKITDDLLISEKLKNNLKKEKINLKKIIKEVNKKLETFWKKKNIKIEVSDNIEIEWFLNKEDFEKIIFNLLHNAIKFSKQNGKIEISFDKKKILIKDFGVGIKKENLNKIFDRFFKEDEARRIETESGSGLGLSIVKELIDKNNLKIRVKSENGKGSEFIILK